jgi:signal transduction histidine kinase
MFCLQQKGRGTSGETGFGDGVMMKRGSARSNSQAENIPAELQTVFTLSAAMRRACSLDQVLRTVLKHLIRNCHSCEAGYFLLEEPGNGGLALKTYYGFPPEVPVESLVDACQWLWQKAFTTKHPRVYPNARILAAPLVANGTSVGILCLHSLTRATIFTPRTIIFVQALTDLLAPYVLSFQLQEELRKIKAEREATCLDTDLLAILSHQLRSPLSAIKGYAATLLREDISWDWDAAKDFLEIIVREADNATAVVTDILDHSAMEIKKLELNKEPVLLRNLCAKVVNELKFSTRRHRFAVIFSPEVHIVEADPARIEQVIRNLIDNAIKYSDGGLIVVRGEKLGNEIVVSVADEGIGIHPEHLNRLFEKYYRVKNPKRHVSGTGLGLPIARQIIEAHGGRIWATSKLGVGSTFYFSLPLP